MTSPRPFAAHLDAMARNSGVLFMIAATLVVPFGDAMSKLLSVHFSPLEIALWRFVFQAIFLGVALRMLGQSFAPRRLDLLVLGATTSALTLVCLIGAFAVMPIATAIATFFVEPLILMVFSVWFLGEKAGWRRFLAVAVGLLGALIIIRPSWSSFGWPAILPLGAAIAFAGNAVVLRKLVGHMSGVGTQFWIAVLACVLLGVALLAGQGLGLFVFEVFSNDAPIKWLFPFMGLLSGITFVMFTEAFRRAEAGVLAPLQYVEIIGATAVGYMIFGDFPDGMTWLGASIILASGIYVIHRDRINKREASASIPNV